MVEPARLKLFSSLYTRSSAVWATTVRVNLHHYVRRSGDLGVVMKRLAVNSRNATHAVLLRLGKCMAILLSYGQRWIHERQHNHAQ